MVDAFSVVSGDEQRIVEIGFDNPRDARLFARRFGTDPIYTTRPSRHKGNQLTALFRFKYKTVAQEVRTIGACAETEAAAD
jgi:hypothetical protein